CRLDLSIFEARYLDMLSRCLRQGTGFGVVCILEGEEVGEAASRFAALGCEALIRDWQQRPDGVLEIRVEGARRFRVNRAEVRRDQLTVAEVDWLHEVQAAPLAAGHAELATLLQALAEHPLIEALGMSGTPADQQALANQLSYLLPFEAEEKLKLLAMGDPARRLEHIQQLLERLQGEAPA
ncbi:LON peptidase substrate-binding domain-containing protein, partial [Azotobacter chroococcum]|nr:LON peptidase substrate-binding domain-containing protein [Azotobacter chroococcum]